MWERRGNRKKRPPPSFSNSIHRMNTFRCLPSRFFFLSPQIVFSFRKTTFYYGLTTCSSLFRGEHLFSNELIMNHPFRKEGKSWRKQNIHIEIGGDAAPAEEEEGCAGKTASFVSKSSGCSSEWLESIAVGKREHRDTDKWLREQQHLSWNTCSAVPPGASLTKEYIHEKEILKRESEEKPYCLKQI